MRMNSCKTLQTRKQLTAFVSLPCQIFGQNMKVGNRSRKDRSPEKGYIVHVCKSDSPAVSLMFRKYCMKYGFDCSQLAKLMFWKEKSAIRSKWIHMARIQAVGEWKKVRQDPVVIGEEHKRMMNFPNKIYTNKKGVYVHSNLRLSKSDRCKIAEENFRKFDIGDEAASNIEVPIVVPIEHLLLVKTRHKVALQMKLNAIEFVMAGRENRDPVYPHRNAVLIAGHDLRKHRKKCMNLEYTTRPNKTILDIAPENSEIRWNPSVSSMHTKQSEDIVFMEH